MYFWCFAALVSSHHLRKTLLLCSKSSCLLKSFFLKEIPATCEGQTCLDVLRPFPFFNSTEACHTNRNLHNTWRFIYHIYSKHLVSQRIFSFLTTARAFPHLFAINHFSDGLLKLNGFFFGTQNDATGDKTELTNLLYVK